MRKIRILVLNYEFPPLGGGASPVSFEISKRYALAGHKVDVLTMGYSGLPLKEVKDGMRIFRVRCLRTKKEMCYPWEQLTYILSAKRFLRKHLKDNGYDACHCHFLIPTGLVALWLKKKYGLPYIITSHGSDIPNYNPDRFRFMHKFTRPKLREVLNNSSGAFAGSKYLSDLGNKIGATVKYRVVREGFDPTKFKPQAKKKIILSTGRLLPRKGFKFLLEAVREKDIGYEVHIAGDGPMMQELRDLAKGSMTKVFFHGWIDNKSEEYRQLLETASVYVLASERENSSVSLLEAMSAGSAVITTNISGCPETVGESGIVVNPRSALELKEAIDKLIMDQDRLKNLGSLARKRVLDSYKWETNITTYLEALNESIAPN